MPTIIYKPTERCNSNCAYCDIKKLKTPKKMDKELLDLVFKKIGTYLGENIKEEIYLTWHGGEPLIMDEEFFQRAIHYQDKYCKNFKGRLHHNIQSNLTLLNEKKVRLLLQLGIELFGTSYEYLEGLRGFGKDRDLKKYNLAFFKGVEILEKHSIPWGFIYVVTKESCNNPLETFYHLINFKPDGRFNLHPVYLKDHEDPLNIGIKPKSFAIFLGEIFKELWNSNDHFPPIDPFSMYIKQCQKYEKNELVCELSLHCADSHCYIGPNGQLSHCGRSADWKWGDYGNLKNVDLNACFKNPLRKEFIKRVEAIKDGECKNCSVWPICHGGCPLDAYNKWGDVFHKTERCEEIKYFIEEYFLPITKFKLPTVDEN